MCVEIGFNKALIFVMAVFIGGANGSALAWSLFSTKAKYFVIGEGLESRLSEISFKEFANQWLSNDLMRDSLGVGRLGGGYSGGSISGGHYKDGGHKVVMQIKREAVDGFERYCQAHGGKTTIRDSAYYYSHYYCATSTDVIIAHMRAGASRSGDFYYFSVYDLMDRDDYNSFVLAKQKRAEKFNVYNENNASLSLLVKEGGLSIGGGARIVKFGSKESTAFYEINGLQPYEISSIKGDNGSYDVIDLEGNVYKVDNVRVNEYATLDDAIAKSAYDKHKVDVVVEQDGELLPASFTVGDGRVDIVRIKEPTSAELEQKRRKKLEALAKQQDELKILDERRQVESRERRAREEARIAAFRKNISEEVVTNCGIVLEVKTSTVKVYRAVKDYGNEHWIQKSKIYPSEYECVFVNGVYRPPQ